MMKLKKALGLALAASMLTATIGACAPKTEVKPETGDVQKDSETDQGDAAELEGSLITAKPTEFDIFLNFNNMPFNPEWRVWKEIAKRTNISLNGIISQSNSNEQEAFNLMLSSGKLADIIGYADASELEKLGRDGGVIPLNDLIDEHAPNIKATLESDEKFRQTAVSLDGNIYQIPKNQELQTAEFWWIRQDWLDNLGLEVPTTVDELYEVLTAFRNNDPNGNGQKDEIPIFDRAGQNMADEYLYLWDTSTEFYPRDGQMTFEPMEENFKVGVKNMMKWYKEELIDPEIFTRGGKSRDILLSGNVGGMTHDWPSTGNYNDSLAEDIPGFEMKAIAPMVNQNGVTKERIERYPGVGWSISSQAKDPVTIIKFMDFFFTEEGSDLMNWGIEGETYTVDNGQKTFTDVVMKSEQTPIGYLRSLGVQYRIGMNQKADYEYAFMTEAAQAATKLYMDNAEQWYAADMPPYLDGKLALKYTPEDEAEYKKIMSGIRPYVDEKFESWILGAADFDKDYDGFIEELKSRGVEKAIEINQRAYETYLGK